MSKPALDLKELAKRVKYQRKALGLTHRGVAARGGPSESMVRKIEDCKAKRPGGEVLLSLAEALETTLPQLAGTEPLPGYEAREKTVERLNRLADTAFADGRSVEGRRLRAMASRVEQSSQYWEDYLQLERGLELADQPPTEIQPSPTNGKGKEA